MALTLASNFTFERQLAARHIAGYFRRELVLGALAWKPPNRKFVEAPGQKYVFPYFSVIGAAEDGVENTAPTPDSLGDASFSATVKEIIKEVDITDSARIKMGCSHAEWEAEAHRQLARRLAEKVDIDLWAEITKAASYKSLSNKTGDITLNAAFGGDKGALNPAFVSQKCNIREIATALTNAFGDKRNEAAAVILHSKHYADIETDATAGFLKADARDPLYKVEGFQGRASMFFNLAFFINDNVPVGDKITVTDSGGATQKYQSYRAVILKKDAFGLIPKKYPKVDYARDVRKRVDVMVANQWLAYRSFHAVISSDDIRMGQIQFLTDEQTA